jgi:hypothetical protein
VVPGWSNESEAAAVDRLERAPGGEQRRLVARLGRDCVRIEERRNLERRQPVEIGRCMAALDLFPRRRAALDDLERLEQ